MKIIFSNPFIPLCFLFSTIIFGQNENFPIQEDIASISGMMRAYYEVVSGPAGEPRQIERDRSLHHPDALIIITGKDKNGVPYANTMTFDEFHADTDAYESGFWEVEISRKEQTYGNITHVWSSYEWRTTKEGPVMGRGINSIQLYNDGHRWWLLSWMYDSEREDNPIPNKFLPAGQVEMPQWLIQDMEQHVGVWIADNSKYQSKDELFSSYELSWEWGINKKYLNGKLIGMVDGKKSVQLWSYIYFWDPDSNEAVLEQFGGDGIVGRGSVNKLPDGNIEIYQSYVSPDYPKWNSKHLEEVKGDTIISTSFTSDEYNNWKEDRVYSWKKIN